MVINEKDIELSKPNRFPPITVKQGDTARQITARLFNNGEQFLVTSDLSVRLNAKRIDGQKNYSIGLVNDDGTVTVQITSWMLAIVGMVTCDISVFLNGQQAFTTTNFYLDVEEATNKDGVIGGDDTPIDEQFGEISLQIERYFEQFETYIDQARQYANQASTVDHIIEQNSGVPVKVWVTNDKDEFDNLETKERNTLHIYPSNFDEEAVLNGTQPVGRALNADNADNATNASNAMQVNGLEITKDENGVLKIGDIIIPQKKLLFSSDAPIYGSLTVKVDFGNVSLIGKTIELRIWYKKQNETAMLNTTDIDYFKLYIPTPDTNGSVYKTLQGSQGRIAYSLTYKEDFTNYMYISGECIGNLDEREVEIYEIIE